MGRAPDGTPYADLRDLASGVALQAAGLVRRERAVGVEVTSTKTSSIDIVTATDRASEALVRDLLGRLRPDDGVVGEEDDPRAGTSGVRWVVDPIDGTVNFLYGIPQYAVSLAVQVPDAESPLGDGWRTVAGVVVNVATGELFEAVEGGGARRGGVPLEVRRDVPLAQRLVLTGFSYDAEQRRRQAEALVGLLPQVRDVRRMGSAALDLCAVAAGQADAYLEEGTRLWDHAAGVLVAREAGARWELLPGVGGRALLLCAPARGYDEIRDAVVAAGFTATEPSAE
ncbi:inositol monophosphatase [Nocardioides zeae]|uniref:Inositol-1-monophosphatase n=1 Tax=Nocardioides zeae TaxID=1457234 RepID=A0A6P0HL40_9ACTN|nr:inositol monophosphatase family protein [Nocardioides zeae]NEN79333.1 inositol monophosphatase [Nocardioides zeae]